QARIPPALYQSKPVAEGAPLGFPMYEQSACPPPRAAVFFSGRRQPPGSTLFPYTTLFRSLFARCPPVGGGERGPAQAGPRRARLDRKSTRLNSSHDQISYAVFCLKKKKPHILFLLTIGARLLLRPSRGTARRSSGASPFLQ